MKLSLSSAFLAFFFVCSSAAQTVTPTAASAPTVEKPRVFITESQSWESRASAGGGRRGWGSVAAGGARPQTAEIIKTFGERCPGTVVNNIEDKADFIVVLDHEGGKGLLQHKNKVVVFERTSGDTVVSKSTLSLGGSVQEACDAITKYWEQNGARLLAAKNVPQQQQATPLVAPPPPAPIDQKPAVAEISVVSTPAGADIEIDGNFVGNAPSAVQLTPGDHLVRITRKGFQPYEKKLPGGSISLRAELDAVGQ